MITRAPDKQSTSGGAGYLVAVLAGALAALGVLFGVLLGLDKTGNLPPPAIANNICIDEKLAFLRQFPPQQPNLLVVGSSVAWRHFDSEAVAAEALDIRPLNGAFCGLRANQTAFVANWLLHRLPTVREVVMIASPQDFETCTSFPSAAFDREDADRFVFEDAWKWEYYLRYFDPASLLRNARRIKEMRRQELLFTRYGDGPLVPRVEGNSLDYGEVRRLDGSCFTALRSMALKMLGENRRLLVVTTPLNPRWKAIYDPDANIRTKLETGILASLADTGAKHWNGDAEMKMELAAFTDAIHLRWSAVREFSHAMLRELRLVQAATLNRDPLFARSRDDLRKGAEPVRGDP